mmetsp:Transcript_34770/g.62575  ORF Transcript_34770/g.62575 Transcript_34770/m.62575 type:complete len:125 (-) Transcript_34770:519-893(-)
MELQQNELGYRERYRSTAKIGLKRHKNTRGEQSTREGDLGVLRLLPRQLVFYLCVALFWPTYALGSPSQLDDENVQRRVDLESQTWIISHFHDNPHLVHHMTEWVNEAPETQRLRRTTFLERKR